MKFWKNNNHIQRVRWYRNPPGSPDVPFPHSFLNNDYFDDHTNYDPRPGSVGEYRGELKYSRGEPLLNIPHDGVCGTADQWLNGSDINTQPSLIWTEVGYSTCCLGLLAAICYPAITGDFQAVYTPAPPVEDNFLILEDDSGFILQEDGFYIIEE